MKCIPVTENHLYSKAYAKGKKAVTKYAVVYILRDYRAEKLRRANPQKETLNRVGLTVSKKIGGAVVRNRCKRVLREAYRLISKETDMRRGFLIIIVARDSIYRTHADTPAVKKELAGAFSALGIINNHEKAVACPDRILP